MYVAFQMLKKLAILEAIALSPIPSYYMYTYICMHVRMLVQEIHEGKTKDVSNTIKTHGSESRGQVK